MVTTAPKSPKSSGFRKYEMPVELQEAAIRHRKHLTRLRLGPPRLVVESVV
jgi:hypothetical protein